MINKMKGESAKLIRVNIKKLTAGISRRAKICLALFWLTQTRMRLLMTYLKQYEFCYQKDMELKLMLFQVNM